MLIDWFTVVAQIVNFLILAFLLKRFLYDRIIRAMDEREEKIRSRLQEGDEQREKAEKEAAWYRQKRAELEDQAGKMLAEAKEEAEKKRKELVEQARENRDQLEKRWKEDLKTHKDSFLRDLGHLAKREVYGISRRVLRDLAEADVEERAITAFLKQMDKMDKEAKNTFASAVQKADGEITVSSGFEIPEQQRVRIVEVLKEEIAGRISDRTGDGIKIGYRVNPDIGFGIEVATRGRKLAWNLAQYLKTLEERAGESLDREAD